MTKPASLRRDQKGYDRTKLVQQRSTRPNLKLGNQAEALHDFSSVAIRNPSLSQSVTALRQLKQETQTLAKAY